jgi:tRNA A-37 threonylcarbamoyl transferase component Bud32
MKAQVASHPSAEQLSNYALGKLDEAAVAGIHRHLEGCEACRQTASSIPADTFVGKVQSAKGAVSVAAATPAPAATLGPLAQPPAMAEPTASMAGLPPELASHSKFQIVRELGRGGMGVVYQARHRLMKRLVAIKVLNARLIDNPASLARFHQEVEAAAQLSHPNIVAAHDAEQAGELHLLVMEYVEGQSLAQVLERKGPLPILHACKFAWQAAKGLQHAHDKKMVHRDIKPQNLMLTPQGVVKILDFGLARLAERPREGALTMESVTMGTPEYIAPEQATDARQADIRSDIYSLGCTLYALLTGRPPFQGETAMQTILAHIGASPRPLQELRPDVPAELAAVVAKMMAKEPADRYQTPAEVMTALAPFCKRGGQSITATVAPWADLDTGAKARAAKPAFGNRRRMLAAIALLAALGLGGWLLAGLVFRVQTPQGTIVLEVNQPDADVFVDGQKITVQVPGDDKPFEITAAPGQHRLQISKAGFVAVTREIELKTGKAEPIRVRLDPVKAPEKVAEPPVPAPAAIEPPPRQLWVQAHGYFIQGLGKDWFEKWDDGKKAPNVFYEVLRTAEFVEFRHYGVPVTFRLYGDRALIKDERSSTQFRQLYAGKWEKMPESFADPSRRCWVQDHGYFLQGLGKDWFEKWQDGRKATNLFHEVQRTPEFVEVRLNGVAVTFRLYADRALIKDQRSSNEFKQLYEGKWQVIPK